MHSNPNLDPVTRFGMSNTLSRRVAAAKLQSAQIRQASPLRRREFATKPARQPNRPGANSQADLSPNIAASHGPDREIRDVKDVTVVFGSAALARCKGAKREVEPVISCQSDGNAAGSSAGST